MKDNEVSNRKELRRGLKPREVLDAVSSYSRLNEDVVLSDRRSSTREDFFYLMKQIGSNHAAIRNREICEMEG